ncbi:flavin-containing monooxygenase [Streptomyces chryseus]
MEHADLVIIGAGQAGLASAHVGRRLGYDPLVLEAGSEAVGAWPDYYESLVLFSPAKYSALPGHPFPGDPDSYPRRDEVVTYLRDYASALDATIRTQARVTSVSRVDGALRVAVDDGRAWSAQTVISATGDFLTPNRPVLPGQDSFTGALIHAADYRAPDVYAGQRVVVVGGGNSAVQIAAELGTVADVTLATRRPISWIKQRPLGRDLHWWLERTRLDTAPLARWLKRLPVSVLDDGQYKAALGVGKVCRREMFTRLGARGVMWANGEWEPVDAIVLATGYHLSLDYLAGSGALAADGRPLHKRGVSTTVNGLGYVGMEYQRSFSSKTLRGVGRDAAYVLDRLRRQR